MQLNNLSARKLFLHRHALSGLPPAQAKGADLAALITQLGFVQLDSIATVERAHHMILFARRPAYRPPALGRLLKHDRAIFEHWTHDASVIPVQFFPYWRLKMARDADRLAKQWKLWQRHGVDEKSDAVLAQITNHGPVCSSDVRDDPARKGDGWWDWHPAKTALEYQWRCGTLSVTHRHNFQKHYDLTERVIPQQYRDHTPDPDHTIDWACNAALDRLGFATTGELAAFWDIITPAEARNWAAQQQKTGALAAVEIENADGSIRTHLARPDIIESARNTPDPTGRIRVLSPFDPALRDRKRAERLFNFQYRIEVFTPAPKRKYGYYVFPLIEGSNLIGRIDMKAHRDQSTLRITAVWPEQGVKFGKLRQKRLDSELARVARFAGCDRVEYLDDWLRDPAL